MSCRMSDWQTKLKNLKGLSDHEKNWVEGVLLKLGDDVAARYFKENEPDSATAERLRPLLIQDVGEVERTVDKRD